MGMMSAIKGWAKQASEAGRTVLCLVAVLCALTALPSLPSHASHEDGTLFEGPDGALDDTAHLEGVYQALSQSWIASLMLMTEQFVSVMMEQMLVVGTFLDAEQQTQVQRLFQELTAQAHKDFHPGFQMCVFTTNVKSLAASEMIGIENTQALDSVLEKREHQHANLATAGGTTLDTTHRMSMFKDVYCDLNESSQNVELLCDETAGAIDRRTKDMDFQRMVDVPYTLNVNYIDGDPTTEEQDIIALAHNLYAGKVFDFLPEQLMNETAAQDLFLETRSVYAIRSVARRSFATIVGMKTEGDPDALYQVRPFMFGIISELGIPDDEIVDFLGENPSYFAQMEVLTRKIYQSPEFFTNLYDKPANVKRMGVALQAIGIMQDRDRFEASLRREMLISLILELKLRKYQENLSTSIFSSVNQKPDAAE